MLDIAPILLGAGLLSQASAPDLLIARDGADVGLVDPAGKLYVLRNKPGSYAQENLVELAGAEAQPRSMADWPGARCSADFCSIPMQRSDKVWHLLVARSRERIDERALAAACERSDIVIADRWLPRSCRPRWLKADGRYLAEQGGTTVYLEHQRIDTVAEKQGMHGWWQASDRR